MSAPSGPVRLDSHHRTTLHKILQHPGGHNVEWRDALSLLQAVGSVREHGGGKIGVTIGSETKVIAAPVHKDLDLQTVVELRRMLTASGYTIEN